MLKRIEFACASLLLAAVVILVAIASVARVLGTPIIWSVEIAQLIFVWLCMLAADLGLQSSRHIGLQIILDNVSAPRRRTIEIINMVVLLGLLTFLLYHAWGNMILMHPRLDGAMQIPGSYFHGSMVVGMALLIRTAIVQLAARIRDRSDA